MNADTDLIREIAEETAIEFKDERLRYHVVQITTETWDKITGSICRATKT